MATFRAPLPFVFRWCTDYSPVDPKLEGVPYTRRIVQKGHREVVFDDLEDDSDGWAVMRHVVRLSPPNRWHMRGYGNRTLVIADYRLRRLAADRTQLELRWRRRASMYGFRPRPKRRAERETTAMWKRFARALEADYRKTRPQGRGRSRARRR